MNYKKAWEELKLSANEELLNQMQLIESQQNTPKKEIPVIDIDLYAYETEQEVKTELEKYNIDELKIIIKQYHFTISEYRNKSREYIIDHFSHKINYLKHRGDCFRTMETGRK